MTSPVRAADSSSPQVVIHPILRPRDPQTRLDWFVSPCATTTSTPAGRLPPMTLWGYGALTARMLGLESLVAQQWRPTRAGSRKWDD